MTLVEGSDNEAVDDENDLDSDFNKGNSQMADPDREYALGSLSLTISQRPLTLSSISSDACLPHVCRRTSTRFVISLLNMPMICSAMSISP